MRASAANCLLVLLAVAIGGAQSPAPPATYATAAELAATIQTGADTRPEMATARISNTDHYRINLVHRGAAAGAIVHAVGTEVHHVTEGAGTLVTGGTIVRPAAGGPATIDGGLSRRVSKGDVILIPQGTPHWYREIEGSITYLEVRFNVPVD
jgi:glc operon protein GlcG